MSDPTRPRLQQTLPYLGRSASAFANAGGSIQQLVAQIVEVTGAVPGGGGGGGSGSAATFFTREPGNLRKPSSEDILRQYGFAPVTLLTLGAFVVAMLDSGLGVLAPDVQRSFHVSDSGLAAAFFAASHSNFPERLCQWTNRLRYARKRAGRGELRSWQLSSLALSTRWTGLSKTRGSTELGAALSSK